MGIDLAGLDDGQGVQGLFLMRRGALIFTTERF
jgi:hypothetical protein